MAASLSYDSAGQVYMDDGRLCEHLETQIEQLAEAIERCRKIILFSKAVIAVGGM